MKATIVFLTFLIFNLQFCLGQETTSRFVRENGGEYHLVDMYLNSMADSLNYWQEGMALPNFLFEKDLDIQRINILADFHKLGRSTHLLSIRKAIFDRVINEEALSFIIEHESDIFDLVYDPKDYPQKPHISSDYEGDGPNFFYMEMSMRDLARKRLKEIRKSKSKFSGS